MSELEKEIRRQGSASSDQEDTMSDKTIFRPYTKKACSLRRSIPGDAICIDDEEASGRDRFDDITRHLVSALAVVRVGALHAIF